MMGNEGISVADAIALRNGGGYGNGGFGDNGAWWVVILILFAGLGGWGRNGFGGGGGGAPAYDLTPGLSDAFNFNQLDNGIRGLE